MATLDQLNAALIKADAAGNVEDAKAFASEIRRMRAEPTTIKAPVVNVGRQPDAIPERDMMQTYGYPVLETVLPVVGGLVGAVPGTVAGPAGTLIGGAAGSGLGYAAAKQIENIYEEQTGKAKAQPLSTKASQAGMDVLTGAAFDVGGRLVLPPLAKAAGWIWDAVSGKLIQVKAGKIVRELAGDAVDAVRNAAASAAANLTAGQAVANVRAPAIQTLQSRMNARNINESTRLAEQENAANLNQLQALAGGSTQVASKNAQAEAKNALNARLIPTLTTELNAANIAGQELPRLQGEADRFAQAAANKVEDVRRFTAAGERAGERAANTVTVAGQPRVPGRYTYMGELEKKAEVEATKAAEGSLAFGEASRFAQQAADSLALHGLKPLKSDAIIISLSRKANDPAYAGNDLVEGALKNVADDIAKWTKNGGVIDAWALDSIRKNSVNAAIQRLRPGMDQTAQKNAAAEVISQIKPILVDAVENAGGTGYGKYLADYAVGRQAIAQTKLGAKAMQLYNDSPDKFIALVEGQSPEVVEKIFGKGSYNIAKEMSYDAFLKLKGISSTVQRNQSMAEQAGKGAEKYGETLRNSLGLFRIPNILSPKVAVTNEALSVLEGKINTKVMKTLEEGMRSGKPLAKLIDTLPAEDRTLVLRLLKSRTGTRAATFGTNALASDPSFDTEAYNNRNALAQ
jgi:hypothetical protein